MKRVSIAVAGLLALSGVAYAIGPGAPDSVENVDGKYFDADGVPTFHVGEDGTVDFSTFSGYRRYHAECHVCHGPDGLGSSYAPNLVESVGRMEYSDFLSVVANGRQNVHGGTQNVMPSFGTNPNVMCYLDDIYIYLRARAQGDIPRGRPPKREDKTAAYTEAENSCMGST
jgi:methanol metabolism-related c-type cytochrome